jgi:hypothetical protein
MVDFKVKSMRPYLRRKDNDKIYLPQILTQENLITRFRKGTSKHSEIEKSYFKLSKAFCLA